MINSIFEAEYKANLNFAEGAVAGKSLVELMDLKKVKDEIEQAKAMFSALMKG